MRRKEREITVIEDIESIILKADVCRVAFANDSFPYIVTMNFGYQGGAEKRFYFHCAPEGKKLVMLRENNYVCFELDIDHILHPGDIACNFTMKYRSVIGWGNISIVSDEEERLEGLNIILRHYSSRERFDFDSALFKRTTILRLDIITMSGKEN